MKSNKLHWNLVDFYDIVGFEWNPFDLFYEIVICCLLNLVFFNEIVFDQTNQKSSMTTYGFLWNPYKNIEIIEF